jgi:DNA-binding transcriptional MerR regulator
MRSSEVSKKLNLPTSTLHKYSTIDYARYLSPAGAGRREYSDQDVRILKLILDMKAEHTSPENIEVTLNSLQASNWERLPALDEGASSIIPTDGNMIAAGQRESALQALVEHLREELKESRSDRDDLLRRLYEAEQLVRLYQSGRLKPEG